MRSRKAAPKSPIETFADQSRALSVRLIKFGLEQLHDEVSELLQVADPNEPDVEFMVSWVLYHAELPQGGTLAEYCLGHPSFTVSVAEREVLDAEQSAWLGIWEVTGVVPDRSVALRDLLTGAERVIVERAASVALKEGQLLPARIVEYRGANVVAAIIPFVLSRPYAEAVVEQLRRKLRRRGLIPADRLRSEKNTLMLLDLWSDAKLESLEDEAFTPDLRMSLEHQLLAEHYATWPDHPLPALANHTPREMARTAKGRIAVKLLLDEMESSSAARGLDVTELFQKLREELGLG